MRLWCLWRKSYLSEQEKKKDEHAGNPISIMSGEGKASTKIIFCYEAQAIAECYKFVGEAIQSNVYDVRASNLVFDCGYFPLDIDYDNINEKTITVTSEHCGFRKVS